MVHRFLANFFRHDIFVGKKIFGPDFVCGDYAKQITACIACHGPKGTGNAQAGFPALSGQHAQYTILQLELFKDKKRSNDLNGIMRDISAHMSTDDMAAVAYYIQGLH